MEIEIRKANLKKIGKGFVTLTSNTNQVFTIVLNSVIPPFGVEKYNDKKILNIEIDPKESNEKYNIVEKMRSFEEFAKDMKFDKIPQSVQDVIQGKVFMSTIKESKNGYLVRTHFNDPDIYLFIKNNKIFVDETNIKNATCDIKICMQGLWYTDNNYGLFWSTKDVQIKKI